MPGSSGSYLLYRKVDAIGIRTPSPLNPTTVLTVGFGFNRFPNDTQDISKGFDQTTLGFPASYVAAQSKKGFPRITADSVWSMKAHRTPVRWCSSRATLSWVLPRAWASTA